MTIVFFTEVTRLFAAYLVSILQNFFGTDKGEK